MARLLHRSKSTKELRTKYELPDEGPPRSSAQFPTHTPNRLTRRRAGTIIEPKQLSPSKSIADLRVTLRQGMLVASPFFPERNPSIITPETSNRQAFPPTHRLYMESLPPRPPSRVSLSSNPSICIAIGSPTREKHLYIGGTGNTPETTGHSASTSIPSFNLPPEPFDISGDIVWKEKQSNGGSGDQQETRGGWRKLFGRTLFGSKKAPAPAQHIPVVEALLQPRHIHIPLVTVASAWATPTVNKLKKEKSQERKIADQKATSETSPQLLNVEIPTVELERYSIMFRGLLRDESPTITQHAQKTSLYDRRRSKDVLSGSTSKERPKLQLEPLKRHATAGGRISSTPSIPHSTAPFSVPPAPKNNARLGRSNTTAALTRDPRPGLGFVLAETTPYTDTIPLVVLQERNKLANICPNVVTSRTGRESMDANESGGSVALSVNGNVDEGDDCWFSGSALPCITDETTYSTACEKSQVIKDLTNPSLKQSSLRQSTPRQLSQKQTSPTRTSPKQSSLKQSPPRTEEELMLAAQQSIQRQISLSQRQLFLPVVRERAKPAREQTPPVTLAPMNRMSLEL
ncbi:hypothetical protein EV426DRAFT_367938 [Tirmania nivea]|nr:hypothetical protein EV426DRAFT_367938 [Tirmania nivea]